MNERMRLKAVKRMDLCVASGYIIHLYTRWCKDKRSLNKLRYSTKKDHKALVQRAA